MCMMLLTNVTIGEEGQKHLIGDGKTKGIILDNLFGMFCYFLKSNIFDFIANVLANVSGLKEGREVIVEQANMLPRLLDMLRWDKVNAHRRTHIIECVRNVAFEYEAMEARFLDSGIVKELAQILANEQGIVEVQEEVKQFKAKEKKEEIS